MENHDKQSADLAEASGKFSADHGENICQEIEANSQILLHWVQYLINYQLTGTANGLIFAITPALREVTASLSLGMVRPGLCSLRSIIDLILTWAYFKDHPIEWDYVNRTGDGFKMKKETVAYLVSYYEFYGTRFGILKNIITRREEEPYRLLSAHIHGQSDVVLPDADTLKDLVRPLNECIDCIAALFEVSEYLNDVLLSMYADNWRALPLQIQNSLENRFATAEQKVAFFSTTKKLK